MEKVRAKMQIAVVSCTKYKKDCSDPQSIPVTSQRHSKTFTRPCTATMTALRQVRCLNNQGVDFLISGQSSGASKAFQSALQLLTRTATFSGRATPSSQTCKPNTSSSTTTPSPPWNKLFQSATTKPYPSSARLLCSTGRWCFIARKCSAARDPSRRRLCSTQDACRFSV